MLSVSNTSVRNSTFPTIPAGSPASLKRSARRKRQIHPGGAGVDRHLSDPQITQYQRRRPGQWCRYPAKFCQPNNT